MHSLYYVQNRINGKMYIGQTTMTIQKRWYAHTSRFSHCKILLSAIRKYGKNMFDIVVFKVCDNKIEADQEEEYWIDLLKPEYNIRSGGSWGRHSEETRKKIGAAKAGNKYALGMKPNSTSFRKGMVSPNKGRRRVIDEFGNVRYVRSVAV